MWNGKEAIDYLVASAQPGSNKPKPDIILMDVQMPVIDGYRATHILRHHAPFNAISKNIPIVAMTASAIQGDREKCKKAGMDDYLAKPVKGKMLEKMLVRWIVQKRIPRTPGNSTISSDEHGSDCEEVGQYQFFDPKSDEAMISKGLGLLPEPGNSPSSSVKPAAGDHGLSRPPLTTRTNSHHLHLPGTESEGDRAARRNAAEEKATSLRDNKLIVAAGGTVEGAIPQIRSEQGGAKLTEANVEKLGREGGQGSVTSARLSRIDTDNDSTKAVGVGTPLKERPDHTLLSPLDIQGSPVRPQVGRRWKDSETTIRPDESE